MAREKEIIEMMVREVTMLRGLNPKFTVSYNNLARKYFKQVAAAHIRYMEDVFKILDLPEFHSVVRGANGEKKSYSFRHPVGCECCATDKIDKALQDWEIEQIDRDFINLFGKQLSREIDTRSKEFLLEVMHTAKVEPDVNNTGIFQPMYFNSVINGGDDATQKAKEVWDRLPQYMKDEHPFNLNPSTVFIKDREWIKNMYKEGYSRVTANISKTFLPGIKEVMKNAFNKDSETGLPFNKDVVASMLNKRFGMQINPSTGRVEGGLTHWQRLVRTEMKSAIDKSQYERFKQADIPYVKMSIAQNACEICQFYADQNGGFYPLDQAPDIPEDTHPNCRCTEIPFYNLPRGINEEHQFIAYPKI